MKVDEYTRAELVENLESWFNDFASGLKEYIDWMEKAETFEDFMRGKMKLCVYILDSLPLSPKDCYFCLKHYDGLKDCYKNCAYARLNGYCSQSGSAYMNFCDARRELKILLLNEYVMEDKRPIPREIKEKVLDRVTHFTTDYLKDIRKKIDMLRKVGDVESIMMVKRGILMTLSLMLPISSVECPYCVEVMDDCDKCLYRAEKGRCGAEDSTYARINEVYNDMRMHAINYHKPGSRYDATWRYLISVTEDGEWIVTGCETLATPDNPHVFKRRCKGCCDAYLWIDGYCCAYLDNVKVDYRGKPSVGEK